MARLEARRSQSQASKLRQLTLPERPVRERGMRYREIRVLHGLVVKQHDVEIQCARTPANRPFAAGPLLDVMKMIQQLARRELGLDCDHLIEKRSLHHWPQRL